MLALPPSWEYCPNSQHGAARLDQCIRRRQARQSVANGDDIVIVASSLEKVF